MSTYLFLEIKTNDGIMIEELNNLEQIIIKYKEEMDDCIIKPNFKPLGCSPYVIGNPLQFPERQQIKYSIRTKYPIILMDFADAINNALYKKYRVINSIHPNEYYLDLDFNYNSWSLKVYVDGDPDDWLHEYNIVAIKWSNIIDNGNDIKEINLKIKCRHISLPSPQNTDNIRSKIND